MADETPPKKKKKLLKKSGGDDARPAKDVDELEEGGGGKRKLLMFIGAGVLLLGLGAGAGYLSAGPHNRKLLGAAKMLKDYGLLSPKLLRTAHPVIGRPKFAELAAKKQRRNAGPRSVTIKKPKKKDPDTGEVVPGSSYITHVNRAGKKIKK